MRLSELEALRLIEINRERGLYFHEHKSDRIIYLPQGWSEEFVDYDEEDESVRNTYCWYGNEDTLAYQQRVSMEMLTTDSQSWFDLEALAQMKQVSEAEARVIDPDLFTVMDAYNSGVAK